MITCHRLRNSSRQCVLRVELSRSGSAESTTVSIVTFGDLSKEKGLSQDTRPAIPTPLPQRQTECVPIDDPVVDATPVTRKLHWVAPKGANGLWGHRLGGHHREVWLSPRDGSKLSSIYHLALLADLVSDGHIIRIIIVNTMTASSTSRHTRTRVLHQIRPLHAVLVCRIQAEPPS